MSSDRFVLVGIGGAGGRIADQVAQRTGGRLRTVAVDTDFAAIARLGHCQQVRVGRSRFDGLGSGGDTTGGRMATEEESEAIRKALADASLAVFVTGLGGGTGSGGTPVILRIAREMNLRTLTFAVRPFAFEGPARCGVAQRNLPLLEEAGDVLVVCENDALCADALAQPAPQAFQTAAQMLSDGLTLLWRLVASHGYLRVDFATLANVLMHGRGRATFAVAGGAGEQRFEVALADLLDHPVRGVRAVLPTVPAALVGIVGGEDLRLKEVGDTMARLQLAMDGGCDVRMGTVFDPAAEGAFALVVLLFHSWECAHPAAPEAPREPGARMATSPAPLPAGVVTAPRAPTPARRSLPGAAAPTAPDRFRNTHAVIFGGEDLDTPTYVRRMLRIDAS